MNERQLAQDCIRLVGGPGNIATAAHCFTRLRLTLKDNSKVKTSELQALPDVLEVQEVGTQTQIVIGLGVDRVYTEVMNQLDGKLSSDKASQDGNKVSIVSRLFDTVTGIFGPIIPVITAAGMVKAVMALMVLFGLPNDSQEYYIINFISDAAFYFFPILLGFSAGNKFGCNPYLTALVGAVLVHPNFRALVDAGDPVSFFGIPVLLYSYSSSVFPIILSAWFMKYVTRFAEKVSPSFIKAILVPLLVLGISAPVAILAIGPIGSVLGEILAAGINILENNVPFLVPTLVGAFCPLLVFVGMHNALTPLESLSFATVGHASIQGPGMLASNIAEGAASLAVALKSKNENNRQLAFSAAATALCGITEPALYGVTFKYKRPLIAVMVGGGIAGLYAGITGIVRYSFGSPGIPTLPIWIGDDPSNFINALITVAISFVATFALTWILGFDEDEDTGAVTPKQADGGSIKAIEVESPLDGEVIPLSEVKDKAFASGAIGRGCAIIPSDGTIYSPVSGSVITVFATKHAIGIMGDDGEEVLIHLGINTVELNGANFDITVKEGDRVNAGDKIGTMDIDTIKAAGYDVTTPVIITNSNEFLEVIGTKPGAVKHNVKAISIFKKGECDGAPFSRRFPLGRSGGREPMRGGMA